MVAVAGRDAGRAPAPARPLLGAGSTYWLLLAVVCALLVIGLVMVLSASSVAALARQGDSYAYFKRQLTWVVGGVLVIVFGCIWPVLLNTVEVRSAVLRGLLDGMGVEGDLDTQLPGGRRAAPLAL